MTGLWTKAWKTKGAYIQESGYLCKRTAEWLIERATGASWWLLEGQAEGQGRSWGDGWERGGWRAKAGQGQGWGSDSELVLPMQPCKSCDLPRSSDASIPDPGALFSGLLVVFFTVLDFLMPGFQIVWCFVCRQGDVELVLALLEAGALPSMTAVSEAKVHVICIYVCICEAKCLLYTSHGHIHSSALSVTAL